MENGVDNQGPVSLAEENNDQVVTYIKEDGTARDNYVGDDSHIAKTARETGIDPKFFVIENDRVVGITDPDTGDTFFSDEDEGEEIPEEGDEPSKEKESYVNKLDEVLKRSGFDIDEIEFEDGSKRSIKDLSEQEQMDIIVQQLQESQSTPTQVPQDLGLNESETNILDFLRSGATPRQLAEAILESDTSYQLSKMSDEEVMRQYMQNERPTFTPEDIEEEIADLKARNKLGREARDVRARFGESDAVIPQVYSPEEFEQERNQILNVAKNINLDASIKNTVLNVILSENGKDDSELIKYMQTPDGLFHIGYLLTQQDAIQKKHQDELKAADLRGYNRALGKL